MGNDSNLQRMMAGQKWTREQTGQLVSHLDAQDWKGVEARVRQTVELVRRIRGRS